GRQLERLPLVVGPTGGGVCPGRGSAAGRRLGWLRGEDRGPDPEAREQEKTEHREASGGELPGRRDAPGPPRPRAQDRVAALRAELRARRHLGAALRAEAGRHLRRGYRRAPEG